MAEQNISFFWRQSVEPVVNFIASLRKESMEFILLAGDANGLVADLGHRGRGMENFPPGDLVTIPIVQGTRRHISDSESEIEVKGQAFFSSLAEQVDNYLNEHRGRTGDNMVRGNPEFGRRGVDGLRGLAEMIGDRSFVLTVKAAIGEPNFQRLVGIRTS